MRRQVRAYFWPEEDNGFLPLLFKEFWGLIFSGLILFFIFLWEIYFFTPQAALLSNLSSFSLYQLLNLERERVGVSPLSWNPKLAKAALLKGEDMLSKGYFGHTSPDGKPGWFFISLAGYSYKKAGENLGIGFLDSKTLHEAWKSSPLHYRNMIDPEFKDIGIGIVSGSFKGEHVSIVVEFFAAPLEKTQGVKEKKVGVVKEERDLQRDSSFVRSSASLSNITDSFSSLTAFQATAQFLRQTFTFLGLSFLAYSVLIGVFSLFKSGWDLGRAFLIGGNTLPVLLLFLVI